MRRHLPEYAAWKKRGEQEVSRDSSAVSLRDVIETDLQWFFHQQLDPDATRMAAFPPRDKDAHIAHWHAILADDSVVAQTILLDGLVAGNIVSCQQDRERDVGYWIGKSFWGRGVATAALLQFLEHERKRPLFAHVAKHNIASVRVLEKCDFTVVGESEEGGTEEMVLVLGS